MPRLQHAAQRLHHAEAPVSEQRQRGYCFRTCRRGSEHGKHDGPRRRVYRAACTSRHAPSDRHNEKMNKEQNNNNISQQYPVEIKQNNDLSTSIDEDPMIKAELRNGFIRKVFGIVTLQLFVTFAFILACNTNKMKRLISHNESLWVAIFIGAIIMFFISVCILSCNRRLARKVPHNYILLCFVTISESILCTTASLNYSFEIVCASIVLIRYNFVYFEN